MDEERQVDRLLADMFDKDTNKRLQVGAALLAYLGEEENSVHDFDDLDKLMAGLVAWINTSHPKICTNGIDLLNVVALVLGDKFKQHLSAVIPALRDRLGDTRQPVRDAAVDCVLGLMDVTGSPQTILDKLLAEAFSHKGWHVREQGLVAMSKALTRFGTKKLLVGRYIATICKLVGDAHHEVREQAMTTLVDIYRHVGDRVRGDVAKRGLPQAKLDVLFEKFDEVQLSEGLVSHESSTSSTSEVSSTSSSSLSGDVSSESAVSSSSRSSTGSRPSSRQTTSTSTTATATSSRTMTQQRSGSSLSGGGESGAVDEDDFERSFEDCTTILSSSVRDIEDEIVKVEETLSNGNLEWDARVAVMKRFKGLLNNGAADLDVFQAHIATLRIPFATALKDLRSSVVREACITVALLATKLGLRLENFCEWVLPTLLLLVPNSAKIMASSGHVCIGFLIRHVQSHRLLPLFATQISNKSALVRRRIVEYIEQICLQWETRPLERQISHLEDCLKKGMNDADSATRTFARQAYWAFAKHFPLQAEKVKNSLEPSRQRMLTSEGGKTTGASTPSRLPGPKGVMKSRIPPLSSGASLVASKRRFTSEPDLSPTMSRSRSNHELSSSSRMPVSGSRSALHHRPVSTATASVSTANSSTGAPSGRHAGAIGAPVRPASTTPSRSKPATRLPPTSKTPGRLEGRHFSDTAAPSAVVTVPSPDMMDDENMQADDLLTGDGGFGSENLPLFPGGYRNRDLDDDNISIASDISTASTASNFSIQSMSGRLHIVEDVPDILRLCQSSVWSDRRDGLASLGQLLQGTRSLFKNEVQRFLELFYKLFSDPHNTVLGIFLDVLMDFIALYRADMRAWLSTLLQRLFSKLGTELRSSISRRMHRLEDVIRDSFDAGAQLTALCKILNDQSQPHHLKVKLALLKYMQTLLLSMEPTEIVNTSEVRQGVTKIAGMANEPRNVEMRRTASQVLHALSSLNEEVFHKLIAALPRNLKDSTLKAVEDAGHAPKTPSKPRSSYAMQQRSPLASNTPSRRLTPESSGPGSSNLRSMSAGFSSSTPDLTRTGVRKFGTGAAPPSSRITPPGRTTPIKRQVATARTTGTPISSGSRTLPRKSTIAAQSKSQPKARSASSSEDSPVKKIQTETEQHTPMPLQGVSSAEPLETPTSNNLTPHAMAQPVFSAYTDEPSAGGIKSSTPISHNGLALPDEATPNNEANLTGVSDQACLSLCVDDDTSSIPQLLEVLSSTHDVAACMQALESLGELAIEDDVTLWDLHFNSILEKDQHLFDDDKVDIRVAALRFFRQLICFQPTRFTEECAHVCIAKLLKCYVDPSQDVVRQVEDMIPAVSTALPAQAVVKSALPVILQQEFPQIICCLKLLTKAVGRITVDELSELLPSLVPALIQSYAHSDSGVRKASVFCLVGVHGVVGDQLTPHLQSLTVSQMRLLTMYIDRAKTSH